MLSALNSLDLVIIVAVFGLVWSLCLIAMLVWSIRRALRVQRIERRLGLAGESRGPSRTLRLWHDQQEATTAVPRLVSQRRFWQQLERFCRDAGWQVPLTTLLLGLLGASSGVFATALIIAGRVIPALAAAAGVCVLALLYTKFLRDRRASSFERQFAEGLALVGRALRAGHPLLGGFQQAADQLSRPACDLFKEICQQQALGVSLEQAVRHIESKYNNPDVKLFSTSVVIQLRSGGNLASLMDRLAAVIRDRLRLGRRIRVLTAQTQLSKRILIGLPFVLFVVINLLNHEYTHLLYATPTGRLMLIAGIASLATGIWCMKRLSVLKY